MRLPLLRALVFAACLVPAVPHAAAPPDISGVWVPESSQVVLPAATPVPAGVPSPPPPPRTLELTITQQGTLVTMARRVDRGGQEQILTSTYTLDGRPTVNRNGPIELTTTAAWEGEALVLTSSAALDGRAFGSVRERFALVEGRLVVDSERVWQGNRSTSHDEHRRR
jgi:hypothetical protein